MDPVSQFLAASCLNFPPPSTININDHGVIPVAIFGSADFDVRQIDPGSCECEGMRVKISQKNNKFLAHYDDVNYDGHEDLVVKMEDINSDIEGLSGTAKLTCKLYDGTPLEGFDSICLVPQIK